MPQENMQATTPTPTVPTAVPTTIYAGFMPRLGASIVDSIIVSIVSGIITFVLGMVIGIATGGSDAAVSVAQGLASIIQFAIFAAYYIYFIGSKGQTLGKMLLKIKVVNSETNAVPGYASAFLREVVGKILSSLVLGLGYLWMLWDPKKQTWHDKIAKTIVIKTS